MKSRTSWGIAFVLAVLLAVGYGWYIGGLYRGKTDPYVAITTGMQQPVTYRGVTVEVLEVKRYTTFTQEGFSMPTKAPPGQVYVQVLYQITPQRRMEAYECKGFSTLVDGEGDTHERDIAYAPGPYSSGCAAYEVKTLEPGTAYLNQALFLLPEGRAQHMTWQVRLFGPGVTGRIAVSLS